MVSHGLLIKLQHRNQHQHQHRNQPGPSPEPTPAPTPEPTPAPGSVPDSDTDPLFDYQWQIKNTGQNNFATNPGTPDVDLNLRQAWVDGYTAEEMLLWQ